MKSITRARAAMLVTIGITLAASACDDDSPIDPVLGDGAYRLEIEGDVERTLTGNAFFGAEEDENGEPIFAIIFGSESAEDVVMVGVSGTTRPAAGSYEIEIGEVQEGDWVGLYAFGDGEELEGFLVADSGTVVLSESGSDVIKGSVLLYLSGFVEGELGEVVVEGEFDARPAPSGS
jgi:hypothetical protein